MTNEELIQKIKAEIERLKEENRKIKCQANERYCSGYDDAFYDLVPFLDTLEEEPVSDDLEEELDRFIASGKSVTVDDYGTYKVSYHDFKKVARHFAEWGKEQGYREGFLEGAKTQREEDNQLVDTIYQQGIEKGKDEMREQLVSDDLEEAADNHIHEVVDAAGHPGWDWETRDIKDAFIAGAKWQKQEMLKDNPVIMSVEDFQALIDSHAKRVEADYKEKMLKDAVDMTLCNLSLGNHMEKVLVPGNRFPNGKTIRVIVLKKENEK